ncbi:DUF433 domain-containing protein [Catellatospora methionotrophica]|uniref:DUF433 domain-containing protein n=1 Tax=Catellatospora methionotrophica TaxID=121620 RepID=UPI00140C6915|nr:DUF433 domain-containing protein [Catellatospora methionotrophica]
MQQGTPCVGGTRIPVETIARLVYGPGGSVQLATGSYPHLTRQQVLVACWYVGMYGTAVWSRRRWRAWAAGHADAMWAGRWNEVPDPPNGDNVQLALGSRS